MYVFVYVYVNVYVHVDVGIDFWQCISQRKISLYARSMLRTENLCKEFGAEVKVKSFV